MPHTPDDPRQARMKPKATREGSVRNMSVNKPPSRKSRRVRRSSRD